MDTYSENVQYLLYYFWEYCFTIFKVMKSVIAIVKGYVKTLILSHQVFEGCLLCECVSVEHNHMTCVTFCLKDCWKIIVKLSDRAIFFSKNKKNLALNLLAIFPTELFQTDLRIDFNHWQLFSKWYFRQSYTTRWHCKNYKY